MTTERSFRPLWNSQKRLANPAPTLPLLALLTSFVAACGGDGNVTPPDPPDPPRATAISISPTSATLTMIGETAIFTASITDQNGAVFAGTASWASDAPDVFTVNTSGTVTAVANGSGTLRATFQSLSATASVTVDANRAPEAVGTISRVQVRVGGDPAQVDVAANFSDPDGDDLTYTVASSDDSTATTSVEGSVVSVTGVAEGEATITVTATDPEGLSAEQSFAVAVGEANLVPEVVDSIAPVTVAAEGDSADVLVSEHFSDPNGDELTFTATSSDDDLATVKVTGDTVTVEPVAAGTLTVTVTATDPDGAHAELPFEVTVVEGDRIPVAGLIVLNGRIEVSGLPILDCVQVNGLRLGNDTYTVYSSVWQRRDDASQEWAEIDGTYREGEVCPYSTEVPGDYRLIGDLAVNGVRGKYRSENFFTVESSG